MSASFMSGPIPPFSNPPINSQFYQPSRFVITAIGLGQTTLVTTSTNMNYVIGQNVRLIIPPSFGSFQLNEVSGYVINLPNPNQVELKIDSSIGVDPFVLSPATTVAQILAIGDINMGIISSSGIVIPTTNIPGAFINISPL